MFSAYHWEYLHRQGLVGMFPKQLGPSPLPAAGTDAQIRRDLIGWGIVEETGDGLRLAATYRPVFDAFCGPPVMLFGTTLLYRDEVPGDSMALDVPESLRRLVQAGMVTVPQLKFLVAVTEPVVASAVHFAGEVAVSGIDCSHVDSVIQAARAMWEILVPGPPIESLPEMTVPLAALELGAKIRVDSENPQGAVDLARVALTGSGVNPRDAEAFAELLLVKREAAAEICVSAWANHRRESSTDAAIGLIQFETGAVLTIPQWRLDGSCYVTYAPATADRWETAITEFVARYQHRVAAGV